MKKQKETRKRLIGKRKGRRHMQEREREEEKEKTERKRERKKKERIRKKNTYIKRMIKRNKIEKAIL